MSDSAPRRRVLLVEDEPSIRELVTLHLSLGGFDVTGVADGTRGLEVARATPFDLVILDVMLPGLDGVTVYRAVRAGGADCAHDNHHDDDYDAAVTPGHARVRR